MEGSIATAPADTRSADPAAAAPGDGIAGRLGRLDPRWLTIGFVVLGIVVYIVSNPSRQNFYNHFVWQADAFLQGRAWIPWPLTDGQFQNGYFQDVFPIGDGRGLLPFPPLPAIALLPFVAAFGLGTDAALVAAVLGGINLGLAHRMVRRLTSDALVAILAALFYGFGTVAWYAAMLGSTWFLAHVVASGFLLLAITGALDADRRSAREAAAVAAEDEGAGWRRAWPPDGRQVIAGLLFGMAAAARLTTLLAAPFFVFVGGGHSALRRGLSAGIGAVIPVLLLLAYNVATSGQLFHPGYEHLYQTEYTPVPSGLLAQLVPALEGITYHPGEWALQDPRYVPQNLLILLAWLPEVHTECGLALLDQGCALIRPDRLGMSVLLTSPAWLLGLPVVLREWRRRIVLGSALAVGAVTLVNLMHFSQGWVQFGYRFSNDAAPFALLLVTLGLARYGVRWWTAGLVLLSIVINAWGVYWGVVLGW
ncbi:MAG: hypothetical protein ACHQ02_00105 [Candidatus Limnocylindrales bacterium]